MIHRVGTPLSMQAREDLACTQLARKNDATTGSFCTRLFSPVSSFSISPLFISPLFISPLFLYLSCFYISLVYISPSFLYLPCFYISPVFISPLFLYLPRTLGLSLLLYSLSSTHRRPRPLASHEASANQGSRGKSPPNWIHLYPGTPAQHSRCLCLI